VGRVNHVDTYFQDWANRTNTDLSIALFTANKAAERHYLSVGFQFRKKILIPDFSVLERVYIKTYQHDTNPTDIGEEAVQKDT
jgi:hypothetical protein